MLKAVLLAASHQRVRSPMTRQNLVGTVTGDQCTDSHLDTDIDVSVTSSLRFPEQEAGAVARASRAQAMSRNVGIPRRRREQVESSTFCYYGT